jgi:predicted dienelactone hydrolase
MLAWTKALILAASAALSAATLATTFEHTPMNRIDTIRPDAPALAGYGDFQIGVRTLTLVDERRVDILNTKPGASSVLYNRELTVEVWYPALVPEGEASLGQYIAVTRNPAITATLFGRAVRDAAPNNAVGPLPLVVISHGYPGNRYLMSHLGENLASKGFVTVSIDHTDSTYDDQQAIASTFYNRPLDQRFVIQRMAELSADQNHFLAGLVDAEHTGVLGYSMGGYGLINNLGAGFSDMAVQSPAAPANDLLVLHAASNSHYRDSLDPRIKAGFAVAPWGMAEGVWHSEALAGIHTPTFYLVGDKDDTVGYETGVRAMYNAAYNSERYLLTFINAGHNAGAPMPLPWEMLESPSGKGADHYIDSVWDNVRMNNVMAHFATAHFSLYLKADASMRRYLDIHPEDVQTNGATGEKPEQNSPEPWPGFTAGSAVGLRLEKLRRGEKG